MRISHLSAVLYWQLSEVSPVGGERFYGAGNGSIGFLGGTFGGSGFFRILIRAFLKIL